MVDTAKQHWKVVAAALDQETDRIWLDEPLEIEKIRNGIIDTGAGSGGQSFSVLVHIEAFLMIGGCNMLFRLVRMAHNQDLSLEQLRKATRLLFEKPFNIFEFMGDCGLHEVHRFGTSYLAALDTLETHEDYVKLSGAMFTYIERMHRWVHFIFPWNIGAAFPHRTPEEVSSLASRLQHAERPTAVA